MDALTLIELKMQACVAERDVEIGHKDADQLMSDLALALSERLYDNEKACVERILAMYTPATKEKWWYA